MSSGRRSFVVIAFALLVCPGPGVHVSEAQIRIESVFPRQLPRGQATVVNVAVPSRDAIQSVEISPAAGVTVSGIRLAETIQGALTWSELTFDVARDAAPGDRTLVAVLPMGRTAPITITIPAHVPSITGLRIVAAQPNQSTLDLQFAAADASADLGDVPYVWFTIGCGGDPAQGVVRGTVTDKDKTNGVVRATIPKPPGGGGAPAARTCDLKVRMTDSGGIESNTLRTAVDLKN